MSWLLWVVGYYFVSRIALIIGTVFVVGAKLDPPTRDDPPMMFLICAPISGEVLALASPFILSFVVFYKFGEVLERINSGIHSRRATKAKLLELRDLQIKVQEAELDRELEQAKHNYNKRQTT